MKFPRMLLFLSIIVVLIKYGSSHNVYNFRATTTGRPISLSTLNLIDFIAAKMGFDKEGWINVSKLSRVNYKVIDIEIQDRHVMCNRGPTVVPVEIIDRKLVYADKNQLYYEIKVKYENLTKHSVYMEYLPLMVPKGKNDEENRYEPPLNSRAFIVCEKSGKEAVLVPRDTQKLEFEDYSWRVQVEVVVEKNPLAKFGRQYKIVIVDDVDIFKDKRKEFIWPLKAESLSSHYFFHKIIDNQKMGNFCTLTKVKVSWEILLTCGDEWYHGSLTPLEDTLIIQTVTCLNFIALTNLFTGLMQDTLFKRGRSEENAFQANTDPNEKAVNLFDQVKKLFSKVFNEGIGLRALQAAFFYNAFVLFVYLMWGSYRGPIGIVPLFKDIYNMRQVMKKAPYVNGWSLQIPKET